MRCFFYTLLLISLVSCVKKEPDEQTLFSRVLSQESGINFTNQVTNQERFNIFSYRNFYNGGGVAIGDINNDGLSDVYLTANMGKNKLFLNKGNFKFEDITQSAGVGGTKGWSTGVSLVDINVDGLLDIYVCNAGYLKGDDQKNELFINNGDLTFSERARDYQLDAAGYTTHAAFFDYDMDGDLDAYILNNSFIPVNSLNYENKRLTKAEDWEVKDFLKGGGDKLLRNDEGKFTDVTDEAGIYSSLIGFGLGITIGDINNDFLPDMYVSNDFFERDYLYINQGNGTFSEEIKNYMGHISQFSMGADMADINNDGLPEVFVTDMLPDDNYRLNATTVFDGYSTYQLKLQRDFYHQYMQNTLQLNNGNNTFSEIAHFSGVSRSDWSWGALMFDADNDGFRDLFISNGIYQDLTDRDFMDFFANDIIQNMMATGKKKDIETVLEKMPTNPIPNKFFINNKDLTFEDVGAQEGFDLPTFSNGAAYGDLDNDGDLDLVVNNVNQPSMVFRNNLPSKNNYIGIKLRGQGLNRFAIGAKIYAYQDDHILNSQLIPFRGFQSSVDYKTLFGLGNSKTIDSLVVIWPDMTKSKLIYPPINKVVQISQNSSQTVGLTQLVKNNEAKNPLLREVSVVFKKHEENQFIDFYQEGLIIKKLSEEGPAASLADVDNDGDQDIFIGGSFGNKASLYLYENGNFVLSEKENFKNSEKYEDTACSFVDVDGDKDLDLVVGSGGNHYKGVKEPYRTRIYLNNGKGSFVPDKKKIGEVGYNTAVVLPLDFDGDRDQDLFIGSRSIPQMYGLPASSYLLQNDGLGNFTEVSAKYAPMLKHLGMVTDAKLIGNSELIVTGEWMAPRIFKIDGLGNWTELDTNLNQYKGWWYSIAISDLDNDGHTDLILGNRGENFYFTGTQENMAKMWVNDFDGNGDVEKIITQKIDGKDMPVATKMELTTQIVSLKKKNLRHADFAKKSIQELFSKEVLEKSVIWNGNYFKSVIAWGKGNGQYELRPLPNQVQFSSVNDICVLDLDQDGKKDLVMSGNDSGFMPQFSKLDASFGHVLMNKGNRNFSYIPNLESGLLVKGDTRKILHLNLNEKDQLIFITSKFHKIYEMASTPPAIP